MATKKYFVDTFAVLVTTFSVALGAGLGPACVMAYGGEQRSDFGSLDNTLMERSFKDYKAAFVIKDLKNGSFMRFSPEQCAVRQSPCSTFKIFNSLVGLDCGVLKDERQAFEWDGKDRDIDSWNRDHTLQTAMSNSVVWYYQKLASLVGESRMRKYIKSVHYGSEDITGGITKFWLESSLKISPDEQEQFLERLVEDKLPFDKRSTAIVRGLLRLDMTDRGVLYGKTGTGRDGKLDHLGWFVGYVVRPDRTYVFATRIEGTDGAGGKKAREITIRLLQEAGLL